MIVILISAISAEDGVKVHGNNHPPISLHSVQTDDSAMFTRLSQNSIHSDHVLRCDRGINLLYNDYIRILV